MSDNLTPFGRMLVNAAIREAVGNGDADTLRWIYHVESGKPVNVVMFDTAPDAKEKLRERDKNFHLYEAPIWDLNLVHMHEGNYQDILSGKIRTDLFVIVDHPAKRQGIIDGSMELAYRTGAGKESDATAYTTQVVEEVRKQFPNVALMVLHDLSHEQYKESYLHDYHHSGQSTIDMISPIECFNEDYDRDHMIDAALENSCKRNKLYMDLKSFPENPIKTLPLDCKRVQPETKLIKPGLPALLCAGGPKKN